MIDDKSELYSWVMMLAEQLDHIEEGLDTINNEMKQAERALKRMSKCCGLCLMPWQRWALSWRGCHSVKRCQVTLLKKRARICWLIFKKISSVLLLSPCQAINKAENITSDVVHMSTNHKKVKCACTQVSQSENSILDVVPMWPMTMPGAKVVPRAAPPVDEDGTWKLEDGTADSSKNHKNWNSGGPKGGRFIAK